MQPDDAVIDDGLLGIDVTEKRIECPGPLTQPHDELGPFPAETSRGIRSSGNTCARLCPLTRNVMLSARWSCSMAPSRERSTDTPSLATVCRTFS